MPRAAYRYRDESNTNEVDRRFFMLEGRFAELSESLGELWEMLLEQQAEFKELRKALELRKAPRRSRGGRGRGSKKRQSRKGTKK